MKKIILLLFLICSTSSLFATDYYVNADTGSDQNSGTSVDDAFRSLRKISNTALLPGDNVYIMNGTYNSGSSTLLVIRESGTPDNWITFQNYQDHEPILEFSGWTGIDLINGASYIKIKGLKIKGARSKITREQALAQPGSCENQQEGGAQGLFNGTGILAVGPNLKWSNSATTGDEVPSHITIEDCEIFDCTSSGIAFQQADYVTIVNNKVYNNCWYTLYGTSGINLYQLINTDGTTDTHNIIANNLIYGNQLLVPQVPYCSYLDGNGLIIDDLRHLQKGNYKDPNVTFPKYSARTLVSNNISVNNGGSGLHFFLSTKCDIYNNTVANNAFQNEGVNSNSELRIGGSEDFNVKNNIFKSEYTVHSNSGNSALNYEYNYQYGPKIDSLYITTPCKGCLYDELVFENEDVTNIRPFITAVDGILKNAGTTTTLIQDDYLGNIRPNEDESFDIGAYELQACYPTTWYTDIDGDGAGDPNSTIEACEQPEGYVGIAGDTCPLDTLKTTPGECGCGVVEGSCDTTCASPEYNSNTIYRTAGNLVLYNQKVYENKWYTRGDLPTNGGPWKLIKVCGDITSDCTSLMQWSPISTYATKGTEIVYRNNIYENQWYSKGDIPSTSEVWEFKGVCDSKEKTLSITTNSLILKGINIYPTTIKELLYIDNANPIKLEIYSITGKAIGSWKLSSGKNSIAVHTLTSGLYLARINNTTTIKLLKK